MRFSLDWIRDFVDLPADVTTETLADRLTAAGFAVEGIEPEGGGSGNGDHVVLDIDVTTNRPDAMCHYGLARELAVLFDAPLRPPMDDDAPTAVVSDDTATGAVTVATLDPGCTRFAATVVRGVTVGASPEWLRRRLESIGVRAINNVVDVTNYLLWSFGQPMHAYDLHKVAGARLVARAAEAGETLVTLDGVERELAAGTLIIADERGPSGLAGVMGGRDSEVTEATVDVVIEAAHFRPSPVRATARAQGLHTDACHRFERGADPTFCATAARLAARMVQDVAGGTLLDGVVDVRTALAPQAPVRFAHRALERFAGIQVAADDVARILGGLGFTVEAIDHDGVAGWQVEAPGWRTYDFENAFPADVWEEILRTIGFDALPATLPAIGPPDAPESDAHRLRRKVHDHLAGIGLAETIAWAFHDRERANDYPSLFGGARPLEVENPLSDRYAVMRRSLLPGVVEAARYNMRRGASCVRLFEIGHVFAPPGTAQPWALEGTPVSELESVAIAIGGTVGSPWERPVELDFFDLKGMVESLAAACGTELVARPASMPMLVDGTSAELTRADDPSTAIGFLGQLAGADDPVPLFVGELATAGLSAGLARLEVTPPPKVPGIAVDATLTHAVTVPWRAIADTIAAADVDDLVGFALENRYEGEGVPAGAVNTTIRFQYHGGDRALTQEAVNDRQARLVAALESKLGFAAGSDS